MAGTNQIKISELPTKENPSTNDYLVMDDGSETSRIKAKDFMVQFTQPINKSIADEETSRKKADTALQNEKANKTDVLSLEEIQTSTDLTGKIASASTFTPFFNVKQDNLATCQYIQIGKLVVVTLKGTLSNGTTLGIPALRNNCIITLRDESVGGIAQVCLASNAIIASGAGSSNFVDGHIYGGIFAYVCS